MKMARPGPGGDGVARRMADAGSYARGVRSSSERIVRYAGFTLTEVLVVTLIVGVLLSFIVSAAFSALTRGHEFAIQGEAGKLALAMEALSTMESVAAPMASSIVHHSLLPRCW